VTERVHDRLCDRYRFESREPIDVKGKGIMRAWILLDRPA
jgi:hypothetical protein